MSTDKFTAKDPDFDARVRASFARQKVMATLGITFARWNSDWRFLFLGVTLLLAMLANRSIRTKAEQLRR